MTGYTLVPKAGSVQYVYERCSHLPWPLMLRWAFVYDIFTSCSVTCRLSVEISQLWQTEQSNIPCCELYMFSEYIDYAFTSGEVEWKWKWSTEVIWAEVLKLVMHIYFKCRLRTLEQFPLGSPQREVLGDAVYIEPNTSTRQTAAHMLEQQTCVAGLWPVPVQRMCSWKECTYIWNTMCMQGMPPFSKYPPCTVIAKCTTQQFSVRWEML
jgi:hypothetical protein